MTDNTPEVKQEVTETSKEYNFRMLEAKYQRQLEQERRDKEEAFKRLQELERKSVHEDDEDDSEPYIDKKKLNKTLDKFGQKTQQFTQHEIKKAVNEAIQEERKANWLNQNKDFYDVLNKHAQTFAAKDPELADTILQMPDGFERQKLVYKYIKSMGLDRPEEKKPSIQDVIDKNKRSPYYQPSGVGSSPYAGAGDFSSSGQKSAYDRMQELKRRMGGF